ncbi:MAG: alpha-glucan family phosphorylase [Candidatus Nanoarchaeia archaeon]
MKEHIAYFSMEVAVSEDIPTYAGGLGVLAGDTLRSFADLEVPVVGITLLYKKGYFHQVIDENGNQVEKEVNWKPEDKLKKLPVEVSVYIKDREVKVTAWQYKIKGVTGFKNKLLFLDTDIDGNTEYDRKITQSLYANNDEYRLFQEIVLGIGGVKIIESLEYNEIQRYHMNEGHSAPLVLELAKTLTKEEIREKCVFTTHTPVAAGHDCFPKELAKELLGQHLPDELSESIFKDSGLNMTYIGFEFSGHINGVAKKHGQVSREMFPGYNIEAITNGVHTYFWTNEVFSELFDKYLTGWQYDPFCLRYALSIPKEEIWKTHEKAKENLIDYVNEHHDAKMDKDVFTIGFARRMTPYKRGELFFSDIERVKKIAKNTGRLQIIFGGKAHPKDSEGKKIIKKILEYKSQLKDFIKVCYVHDYSIEEAKMLVSGVDLWLNTPKKPMEASGTSGMKAAHNGVPQFSVLDGWWLEGHLEGITGWSIGAHPDEDEKESNEVEDLYSKLEYVILPLFYDNRSGWIDVMRNSISINASFFNTHRMVQQYVLNAYYN